MPESAGRNAGFRAGQALRGFGSSAPGVGRRVASDVERAPPGNHQVYWTAPSQGLQLRSPPPTSENQFPKGNPATNDAGLTATGDPRWNPVPRTNGVPDLCDRPLRPMLKRQPLRHHS